MFGQIPYTITIKESGNIVHQYSGNTDLKIYLDDVLLQGDSKVMTFTEQYRNDYYVLRLEADLKDEDGTVVKRIRNKIYYFVYEPDLSVIED